MSEENVLAYVDRYDINSMGLMAGDSSGPYVYLEDVQEVIDEIFEPFTKLEDSDRHYVWAQIKAACNLLFNELFPKQACEDWVGEHHDDALPTACITIMAAAMGNNMHPCMSANLEIVVNGYQQLSQYQKILN